LCPDDLTVSCSNDVPAPNTASIVTSDNCGGSVNVTVAPDIITNEECTHQYVITRIYTATDLCGNTSTCVQTISIFDTIAPTLICPEDITVSCTADLPEPNVEVIIAGDNCNGEVMITVSPDVINDQACDNRFTITRIYTATDVCGNTSTCAQTITAFDMIAPSITAPANVTVECANDVPAIDYANVMVTDNCIGQITTAHLGDEITGQVCVNQFILTRTYQATDACGNTAIDEQEITVGDYIAPVIAFTDPLIAGVPNGGTVTVQCYGQDPNWGLPRLDESSIDATDNCGIKSVDFQQELEEEADCKVDGYINIIRLTWIALDSCENSTTAFVFMKLVDTIPPVIHDVPADITVNVNNIPPPPNLYATDECLCSCIVLLEDEEVGENCLDGKVLKRTWEATDDCGNKSVAVQYITLVDKEGPEMAFVHPALIDMADGAIMEYSCNDGGIPAFYTNLDEHAVLATDVSGPTTMRYTMEIKEAQNCIVEGYIEQRTFLWEGFDLCGNVSTSRFMVRLIDKTPPLLEGVPDMVCVDDPVLQDIYAVDDCGNAFTRFWELAIPNPCGEGLITSRVYEAADGCGNTVTDTVLLIPDDRVPPVIEFIDPAFSVLEQNDAMIINCDVSSGKYTSYGVDDVIVADPCPIGLSVEYTESVLEFRDCTEGGILAIIQMQWKATDICGNVSIRSVKAHIVDTMPPQLLNFDSDITIGCDDAMPAIQAIDNCGEVGIKIDEIIVPSTCIYEYDVLRTIIATDECGNSVTAQQRVHIGESSGPIIKGVETEICDDLSIPVVTAYDPCADTFVEVTMSQDTLESACRDGMVIERIWTATDLCGDLTVIRQLIVIGDITPPQIIIPANSIIHMFMEDDIRHEVNQSQVSIIKKLDDLDDGSVYAEDDCDQVITPVFRLDIERPDNCISAGFFERRTYTWVATDICNNSSFISFSVFIKDDLAPVFENVPADDSVICEVTLPDVPQVSALDASGQVTISFTESSDPGTAWGEYLITRSWTATDGCGNTSVAIQRITWIPDTYVQCDIITPIKVDCNTHGILIQSTVSGGIAPYTYYWEVIGESCFIQGGQTTQEIFIYIGWSPIQIRLTVTDAYGCVMSCSTAMDCIYDFEDALILLPGGQGLGNTQAISISPAADSGFLDLVSFWPNPAQETLYLSFESGISQDVQWMAMNLQGQVVLQGRIDATKGFNAQKIDVGQIAGSAILVKVETQYEVFTKMVILVD
jgi:hypothetical protein